MKLKELIDQCIDDAKDEAHALKLLLKRMDRLGPPPHSDDIRVSSYVVHTHWRRRWKPNVVSINTLRRQRSARA